MLRRPALNPLRWALLTGLVVTAYLLPNPWRNTSAEAALLAAAGEVCVVAPPTLYDPKSGLGLHEAFYVSGSNAVGYCWRPGR